MVLKIGEILVAEHPGIRNNHSLTCIRMQCPERRENAIPFPHIAGTDLIPDGQTAPRYRQGQENLHLAMLAILTLSKGAKRIFATGLEKQRCAITSDEINGFWKQ